MELSDQQKKQAISFFKELFERHNSEVYALMNRFEHDVNNTFENMIRVAFANGEAFMAELKGIYESNPSIKAPEFLKPSGSSSFLGIGEGSGGSGGSGSGGSGSFGEGVRKWVGVIGDIAPGIIDSIGIGNSGGGGDDDDDGGGYQRPYPPQPPQNTNQSSGSSNMVLYVGLGVFGLLVIGLIIVLAVKG